MKHLASQFPLPLPAPTAAAPFRLEVESAPANSQPQGDQAWFAPIIHQPAAQTPEEWLARLSPKARARALARRRGPSQGMDPVTGLPFCQQVRCVACGWTGSSPVKRRLRVAGRDYPLECGACHAIAIEPMPNDKVSGGANNQGA